MAPCYLLPDDDSVCVKYLHPVGGISSSRYAFPTRPQIVWVHARLVRKVMRDPFSPHRTTAAWFVVVILFDELTRVGD